MSQAEMTRKENRAYPVLGQRNMVSLNVSLGQNASGRKDAIQTLKDGPHAVVSSHTMTRNDSAAVRRAARTTSLIVLSTMIGLSSCGPNGNGREADDSALPTSGTWTPWISRDTPGLKGDFEQRHHYEDENRIPCEQPTDIQCRTKKSSKPASTTGQTFFEDYTCTLEKGLVCLNDESQQCLDYQVRYFCPENAPPVTEPQLPDVPPKKIAVGTLPGTVAVDQAGRAIYQIPLKEPPASGGVTPNLSIAYQSGGTNGILGRGWQLVGPSVISRSPAAKEYDGFLDPVDFDKNDQLELDGQRLIKVGEHKSGSRVTHAIYRTAIESRFRVVARLDAAGQPWQFTVDGPDRSVRYYGTNEHGRIFDKDGSFAWFMQKSEDFSGNYTEYDFKDGLLREIRYSGNDKVSMKPYATVELKYEPRPDVQLLYAGGTSIRRLDQRLKKIVYQVEEDGTKRHVREYRFDYQTSKLTGNSNLISVQEVAGLNANEESLALPPTRFVWRNGSSLGLRFPKASNIVAPNEDSVDVLARGDFDGDAKIDFIMGQATKKGRISKTANTLHIYLSSRAFTREDAGLVLPTKQYSGYERQIITSNDFDGDGLTDLLMGYVNKDGQWRVNPAPKMYFSNGDGSFASLAIEKEACHNVLRGVGDFNGDGYADLLMQDCILFANPGSKRSARKLITKKHSLLGTSVKTVWQVYVAELDGDGRADIITEKSATPYCNARKTTYNTYVSAGEKTDGTWNFEAREEHTGGEGWRIVGIADFNGDGLTDMLRGLSSETTTWCKPTAKFNQLYLRPSKGNGFMADWRSTLKIFPAPRRVYGAADMDGDGRADVRFGNMLYRFTGKEFVGRGIPGVTKDEEVKVMGDMGGDGIPDYVIAPVDKDRLIAARAEMRAYNSDTTYINEITKIENGLGSIAKIEYERITDPDVYTRGTDAVFPKRDFFAPYVVVSKLYEDNGLFPITQAKAFNVTRYEYEEGIYDVEARQFTGFKTQRTIDEARGSAITATYDQGFPCRGQLRKKTVSVNFGTSSEQIVREVTHDLQYIAVGDLNQDGLPAEPVPARCGDINPQPGLTYFPFAGSSTQKMWEVGKSQPWEQSSKNFKVDHVGNMRLEEAVHSDRSTDQIHREFEYYTKNIGVWIPGRITFERAVAAQPGSEIVRKKRFEYVNGYMRYETRDEGTEHELKLRTDYDAFGNKTVTYISGRPEESHVFDKKGRFPICTKNAAGHLQVREYDAGWGLETRVVDANALARDNITECPTTKTKNTLSSTKIQYDALGRKTKEFLPHAGSQLIVKEYVTSLHEDGNSKYRQAVRSSGSPLTHIDFDRLERPIREATGAQGNSVANTTIWNVNRTVYDTLGRKKFESNNYRVSNIEADTEAPLWRAFEYDSFDRVTRSTNFDTVVTRVVYDGRKETTHIEDADGVQISQEVQVKDARGRLIETEDDQGGLLLMQYDVAGRVTKSSAVGENKTVVTEMKYDLLGNRTALIDQSLGRWTYEYNKRGRLTAQTDGLGRTTTMEHDALGRMTKRTMPEGTEEWVYDRLDGHVAIGKMLMEVGLPDGGSRPTRRYRYDEIGRLEISESVVRDAKATIDHKYDVYNNVTQRNYSVDGETWYRLTYHYDRSGHLSGLLGSDGRTWFSDVEYDAAGEATSYVNGANIESKTIYNKKTRLPTWVKASKNSTDLMKIEMKYDLSGNMTARKDHELNVWEVFGYDSLNRLTANSWLAGKRPESTWKYDSLGNITHRDDTYYTQAGTKVTEGKTFAYQGNRPHAVTAVGDVSYLYDEHGNMTQRGNSKVAWTSFNMPSEMWTESTGDSSPTFESELRYDAAHQQVFRRTTEEWTGTTVYEDAEDLDTAGWDIYDATPAGATVENVSDPEREGRVIQLSGSGIHNGFRLRRSDGAPWNMASHSLLSWDMKFTGEFTFYVSVDTTAGHRYLQYDSRNDDQLKVDASYIHHGLGDAAKNGQWQTVARDLEADILDAEPGNKLIRVKAFLVRGDGRVDNIGAPLSDSERGRRTKDKYFWFQDFERTDVYEETCSDNDNCVGNWSKGAYVLNIAGPMGLMGSIALSAPSTGERSYFLTDHLGTVVARTDHEGTLEERYSYDAWGRRRDFVSAVPYSVLAMARNWTRNAFTDRGYTGQEMMDAFGLVHMKGRIYDPEIGRFLSPDPFVRDKANLQAHNRYSYVLNNPLVHTDPSGFFLSGFKKFMRRVMRFFKRYGGMIAAAIAGAFTGGLALALTPLAWSAMTTATVIGMVSGFTTSFMSAVIGGQGLSAALKAGLRGGLVSGVMAGVSAHVLSAIHAKYTPADKMRAEFVHVTKRGKWTVIRRNVPMSEVNGKGIVMFGNGQSNDLARAAKLGLQRTGKDSFYMAHNPTVSGPMDTIESALGKLTGRTPVSESTAEILSHIDLTNSHLHAHSQGGIITRNALVIQQKMGQNMAGLKVAMDGAAVNWASTSLLFKTFGVELPAKAFTGHAWDMIHNLLGYNALFPVPNPYRIAGSVLLAPWVFKGGPVSPHGDAGGGAAVRWIPQAYGGFK